MSQEGFTKRLRNLREKIVDRMVFGADEALELIDLLGEETAQEEVKPPTPPVQLPPISDAGGMPATSGAGATGGSGGAAGSSEPKQ